MALANNSCFLPILLRGSATPVIGMKLLASAFLSIVNGEEAEWLKPKKPPGERCSMPVTATYR